MECIVQSHETILHPRGSREVGKNGGRLRIVATRNLLTDVFEILLHLGIGCKSMEHAGFHVNDIGVPTYVA